MRTPPAFGVSRAGAIGKGIVVTRGHGGIGVGLVVSAEHLIFAIEFELFSLRSTL